MLRFDGDLLIFDSPAQIGQFVLDDFRDIGVAIIGRGGQDGHLLGFPNGALEPSLRQPARPAMPPIAKPVGYLTVHRLTSLLQDLGELNFQRLGNAVRRIQSVIGVQFDAVDRHRQFLCPRRDGAVVRTDEGYARITRHRRRRVPGCQYLKSPKVL